VSARDLVNQAAADARADDGMAPDFAKSIPMSMMEPEMESPLDEETLDEQATSHMGERWEMPRRDAN